MKRRVIKQKSAYTLTLPVEWVREHNIKAKDEVEIEKDADSLIISTDKKSKLEEVSLTLEKSTKDYYRIMIENHYLKGYDVLNVKFVDEKAFNTIQKVVSNLMGFEVLEQRSNFCKVGATSVPSNEQFKTLLNRCFNIITYTQEMIKEDLDELSFTHLRQIKAQTDDARKFLLFCTRTLHKNSLVPRKEESFMHLLLERLILIQHNNYYLYKKLGKGRIRKSVKELYFKSTTMFDLFKEMFYKKDLKNFAKINRLWEEVYFSRLKCNETESVVLYHSMHLAKLVFLVSQPNLVVSS